MDREDGRTPNQIETEAEVEEVEMEAPVHRDRRQNWVWGGVALILIGAGLWVSLRRAGYFGGARTGAVLAGLGVGWLLRWLVKPAKGDPQDLRDAPPGGKWY